MQKEPAHSSTAAAAPKASSNHAAPAAQAAQAAAPTPSLASYVPPSASAAFSPVASNAASYFSHVKRNIPSFQQFTSYLPKILPLASAAGIHAAEPGKQTVLWKHFEKYQCRTSRLPGQGDAVHLYLI